MTEEKTFLVKTVNKEEKAELYTHLFPPVELTKDDLHLIRFVLKESHSFTTDDLLKKLEGLL